MAGLCQDSSREEATQRSEKPENVVHSFIAGAVAGLSVVLVGFPFDTVKVQQQTRSNANSRLSNIFLDVNKQTWSRGFLRGLSWPLCTVTFTNAVFWGVNNGMLTLLSNDKDRPYQIMPLYIAGCVGSFAEMTFTIPVDYVKVVLQSQAAARQHDIGRKVKYFQGPVDFASYVYRSQGLLGFYKGAPLMIGREIPLGGLFMVNCHQINQFLLENGLSDSQGLVADGLSGGCAGSVNWVLSMPFDVVKSRYQSDTEGRYKGIADCAYKSFKSEGLRVFTRGTFVACLRAFPVNAANTFVYFQVMKCFKSKQESSLG